jgi:hypothetical protein
LGAVEAALDQSASLLPSRRVSRTERGEVPVEAVATHARAADDTRDSGALGTAGAELECGGDQESFEPVAIAFLDAAVTVVPTSRGSGGKLDRQSCRTSH